MKIASLSDLGAPHVVKRPIAIAMALALSMASLPTWAAETCGNDPATSINHSSNYILGTIGTDAVAMHWPTGLVWKRCLEGQTWNISGTCLDNGFEEVWGIWMYNHMPKSFSGQDARGIDGGLSTDRLADGGWRLPYSSELHGLATGCLLIPPLIATMNPIVFPGMPANATWSGSPASDDLNRAYLVYFGNGQVYSAMHSFSERARLVRGGQAFGALAPSAGLAVAPGAQASFGPIVLPTASGSGAAWGGARISGDASAQFQVNEGPWVTESIVSSGDAITVRMTAGDAGSARIATLTLRGVETTGTTANGANGGSESSAMRQTEVVFSAVAATAAATAITSLLPDPAAAGTVYSGVDGMGIYKTLDHGANWAAAITQPTNTRIRALVIEDSDTLYAASHGGGVFKSIDAGLNWAACASQPDNLNLYSLARAANGLLYAGAESGVFVSADGCETWAAMNTGLPD